MVKSASRVMEILKIISSSKNGLKHCEIADVLGIPKGSLTFLLADLTTEEFLMLDNDGHYKIGPQILILANSYLANLDIINFCYPVLKKLVDKTDESSGLAIPKGRDVIIAANKNAQQQLRTEFEIGVYFPMYASALGKVFLAHFSEEKLNQYLSTVELIPVTKNTIIDPQKLLTEIQKIRKDKIAYSFEEQFEGRIAMAVPVFSSNGEVVASISSILPTVRFIPEKEQLLINGLLEASKELSNKLGYAP